MSKFLIVPILLLFSLITSAQIQLPALSPAVEIIQQIGLTTADLSYSRPSLRGRDLFGPEGILIIDSKWRTGANATTKLEISKDIRIMDSVLPAGTYALLSTPHKDSWTFHFYPFENGSYTKFLDKNPILEVTAPISKTDYSLETLSLDFQDITLNSANFVLQWGHNRVIAPISLDEHEAILSSIDRELSGPTSFDFYQAALYLHETKTDLPQALAYIRNVTEKENPLFFQVYREALILKDLNRPKEAIEAAKRSMKISEKAGNADFVRLNQQLIDELSN